MPIDYRQARLRMVEQQLCTRGITDDRVLAAFRDVPRHRFVDSALEAQAYTDRALPISHGQTISQPYMVAIMTQYLAPDPRDRVLEIGTGSGYQAAILSRLARSVFTVERIAELAQRARQTFADLGVTNVIQRVGDGSLGWVQYAPYDGILVTAGAPHVPASLRAQLADGGRLVVPTGSRGSQMLRIIQRLGEEYREESAVPCIFVPLLGEEGWAGE
jgi:protein-L-isoaspartate(D-aspartate) O-methyltransferase